MNQIMRTSSCDCGQVRFEATGAPLLSGVCYCNDCQQGGRQIEALPSAKPVRDGDGGTAYLTYRDDRIECVSGEDLLVDYKIRHNAPTRRVVASCCNSGMYLKYDRGHWTSAYRARFKGELPPIEMRNKIANRMADTPVPQDAPSYRGYPAKLFWRLIKSRIAMIIGI